MPESAFLTTLADHGVSRRDFLRFCGTMATALSLPAGATRAIAAAVAHKPKPALVWLEFQDCAGNSESFLRASRPSVADVIIDLLSLDYHETIMAAAGHQAEEARARTIQDHAGKFIAVVEGRSPSAPTVRTARSAGAPHWTSRGRSVRRPQAPSPSAPAPPSEEFPRRLPTPRRPSPFALRCPA